MAEELFYYAHPFLLHSFSKQRIPKIKKLFLKFVGFLKEHDLIESNYKIISDGYYHSVQELNIHNISEGFILYQKLSI
jgi:hypothetical protein